MYYTDCVTQFNIYQYEEGNLDDQNKYRKSLNSTIRNLYTVS